MKMTARGSTDRLFAAIADRYDLINLLISFGLLPLWRKQFFCRLNVERGQRVLDVCAGTGWLTLRAGELAGQEGYVSAVDLCPDMLAVARGKLERKGMACDLVVADAECLPYEDNSFDRVMLGFGLRNVADMDRVLAEMCRVCVPGGRVAIIELTHPPTAIIRWFYKHYRWLVLPVFDLLIRADKRGGLRPYTYLGRSVDAFCDAKGLMAAMEAGGWTDVTFDYLGLGAVAIHTGLRT